MPLSYNKFMNTAIYGKFGVFNDSLNNINAISQFSGDVIMKNKLYVANHSISVTENIPALYSNDSLISNNGSYWLNGEYICSASNGQAEAYRAFDQVPTTYVELPNYLAGNYIGTITTKDITTGETIPGHWIQVKTPYKGLMHNYSIYWVL